MTISPAILERAGIHVSPEEFEHIVITAVEQVAPYRMSDPGRDLTPDQLAALRRGGIDPVTAPSESTGSQGPAVRGAALYAAILATSLSVPETAKRLGVDESRVRQRIHDRTLYAIKPGATWRVPIFQFLGNQLVPAIDRVFPRLSPGLSPLTVIHWFQRPSSNLVTNDGVAHSPLDWLKIGYSATPVMEAAEDLGRDG